MSIDIQSLLASINAIKIMPLKLLNHINGSLNNLLILLFITVFLTLSYPLSTQAAEVISGESLNIDNEIKTDNLYLFGNSVNFKGTASKEVIIAGGNVNVQGNFERNLYVAGGTVDIDIQNLSGSLNVAGGNIRLTVQNLEGSLRIAGGNIEIQGTFQEDLLVAGGSVLIKNANIKGDVFLNSGELNIQDSKIEGNFYGNFEKSTGNDPQSQVTGDYFKVVTQPKEIQTERKFLSGDLFWKIATNIVIGLIVGLLIWFLNKRQRLEVSSIKINMQFLIDFLIGLALFPFFIIIGLLSLPSLTYPLILPLIGLCVSIFFLIKFYVPIYTANLLKNSITSLKISLPLLSIIVYITITVLNFIPVMNFYVFILMGILTLSSYSFLLRKAISLLNSTLQITKEK